MFPYEIKVMVSLAKEYLYNARTAVCVSSGFDEDLVGNKGLDQ